MSPIDIRPFRRGTAVKRYHTSPRLIQETVGHHTANLLGILLALEPAIPGTVLVAALMHDIDEAYTGDVPAPCKVDRPELAAELKAAGDNYRRTVWRGMVGSTPLPTPTTEDYSLLKLADILDLIFSSYEELRLGNQNALEVALNGLAYMRALNVEDHYRQRAEAMLACLHLPEYTNE
jgi:5'-deoxynucleotidase YfbR-like HD superfamily hydrolase